MPESADYTRRKAFFDRVLTVYGRKPVLEALRDSSLECHALHLADSNRPGGIIAEITSCAASRNVPVQHHARDALSRISKNGRQDQGVALDILCPSFQSIDDYLANLPAGRARLLALDGISNPQNLGMIIRAAAAGAIDGILIPAKGSAALGPLVIKASAGTVYRAPIVTCDTLPDALTRLADQGFTTCAMAGDANTTLFDFSEPERVLYVLGNESDGISAATRRAVAQSLSIPMNNGVESLNVAVTASLVAFAAYFER
ncbi:MAG: RNA methyltransferase [Halioglobus sp.]|nr:RNA methyltransferase [Halioglobus sp.]